ncbi:MAG TPA: histidine utilization repressor [Thermomicrobiales bacterium]|nr:histidine utilization repressor [Thermomicrobiales bacterium]
MRENTEIRDGTRRSLHDRIVSDIRDRILSGEWAPGHRIPSEMALASEYDCSRMTINKAVTQLARTGYLERRRRAGTFVLRPQASTALLEIPDIRTEIIALGEPYRFELIDRRAIDASVAGERRLELKPGDPVLQLTCLHHAGETPFCLEERLINLSAVPDARHADFSAISPGGWLLQQVPWQEAEHVITAVGADARLARMLAIPEGAPCLSIERRTWNSSSIVTWVRIAYPAANHSLIARFTPS